MAAIVEEKAAALETQAAPARPDWREEPYTWFLAGLVVANVAVVSLLSKAADDGESLIAIAIYGMLLGQLFLLAFWLAYGGLHVAGRFLAVAAAMTAGAAALGANEAVLLPAVGVLIVLFAYAALLPLRTLLGWRVDFDPAYHVHASRPAMQLRLSNILVYTAVCALPCAFSQWFADDNIAFSALIILALTLPGCLPVALLIVSKRRTWRFWSLCTAMLLTAFVLHLVQLKIGIAPAELALGLQFGAVAAVALNLGLPRLLFGLRLFSVFDPALAAAARPASVDAELAYLIAVWPQLPAATRSELFEQVRKKTEQSQPTGEREAASCEASASGPANERQDDAIRSVSAPGPTSRFLAAQHGD